MARKKYLPYPVDRDWLRKVRDELEIRGRGAQADLQRYIRGCGIKVSSGQLAETLAGEYQTSVFVGPIHEFFDWPAPITPLASKDVGEAQHLVDRLTPEQRQELPAFIDALSGASGEDARRAVEAILALLPKRKDET